MRKRNGRRDKDNGSTDIRSTAGYGEGEYTMVSSDGGREKFWSSSDNIGVLGKTTKISVRCRGKGGVKKVRHA